MFASALGMDVLWDGEMRGVVVNGKPVLLIKIDKEVHAYENKCAHLGVPLSEDQLIS